MKKTRKYSVLQRFSFFFAGLVIILYSCNKEEKVPPVSVLENELEIKIQSYFGNDFMYLDSTYTTSENYKIRFTDCKFFLANISNGSKGFKNLGFFDAKFSSNIECEGIAADFVDLSALVGVDSLRNHSDPSAFDINDPLNIMNAGEMHWGWNPGYIFVKIEAKLDTINDGIENFDHFVTYHVGKDENIGNIEFTNIPWKKVSEYLSQATLKVDLKAFLTSPQAINLKTEIITHSASGQEALSTKVMQNFVNSLSFLP
jgi:hypothetical protein